DRRNPVEVGFAIQSSEVRERSIEGMRAEVAHDFSHLTDWNPIGLDSVPDTGGLSLTLEFVQHPWRNVEGHNLNPCLCEGDRFETCPTAELDHAVAGSVE